LLQYQKAIESQIPAHIAPEQELSVWDAATTFTIGPDGKVKEQKIKRTSGSQRVDSSVTHAIAQAAPSVNLTDTDNAEFQANVAFNGIVDGKVVKNAQPTCTVQLVNW
jgi:TonB family protein